YTAVVRPYAPQTGGTFAIRATELGAPGGSPTAPAPSVSPAPLPTPGASTVHVEQRGITLPDSPDFAAQPSFEMELEAGRTYVIETFDLAGSTDTVLSIHQPSGGAPSASDRVLAENDDADGLASRVTFTPPQSGAYYAHVRPYGPGTGGTFGFRVTER
ncbi:MAG: PPC domain-containing protein, partial [Myxococcales bacterium]|nr:PPC domain-containing protein [Myxococcales bacterium]